MSCEISEGFAIGASDGSPESFASLYLRALSRGTIGLASLTVRGRPSISFSCISVIAFLAASSSENVINPNPFDLPENLSLISTASSTSP